MSKDLKPKRAGDVILFITAGFSGKAATFDQARDKCIKAGGQGNIDTYGYMVFSVHPETNVNEIDSSLWYPEECEPIELANQAKSQYAEAV